MLASKEIHLLRYPKGMPTAADFVLVEVPVSDELAPGEVLVRNLYLSVDPYMRGRMSGKKTYIDPFPLNAPLSGGAVGIVVKSRHPDFPEGQIVDHAFGWRELFKTANIGALKPRPKLDGVEPSAWLGILGMPGMTSYFGLLDVGALQPGDTVFVSGAGGAVGSLVGQIAKLKGAHVIGSAGSDDKVRYLVEKLGFDRAFNYKSQPVAESLAAAAPRGIDVYFDNVGGDHLEAAIAHMNTHGRIALCGAISQYNDTTPAPGPRNLALAITRRLVLRGFIVSDFHDREAEFTAAMLQWVEQGRIRWQETTVQGVDKMVEAFLGLFTGKNLGKMVVKV